VSMLVDFFCGRRHAYVVLTGGKAEWVRAIDRVTAGKTVEPEPSFQPDRVYLREREVKKRTA
jgi:hypothetical protein